MKLIFTLLVTTGLTLTSVFLTAQQAPLKLTFETEDSTSVQNGLVDVDVKVEDFNNIVAAQFTVLWDSLVLEITDIPFISNSLNGLNSSSFSLPEQTTLGTKGRLRFAWVPSDAQGKSLPDDHVLFTMRFKAVGAVCSHTSFELLTTNTFQTEIIENQSFNNIGATYNHLPILITGANCTGFVETMACNDNVNIALSPFDGMTTITPEMILEGGPYDYSVMQVSPSTVDCDDIGNDNLIVTVTNTSNGTPCWGRLDVQDKFGPVVILDSEVTVNLSFSTSSNPLRARVFVETLDDGSYDNCSGDNQLTFSPAFFDFNCSQLGPQTVTVTVTDAYGNSNTAITTINVELKENIQIACPPNVVVNCGTPITDEEVILNDLGVATSSTGCIPLYEDFQGYDQNQDGDMDDQYTINGVVIMEKYEEACEFGSISRVWSIPGSTTACRQIIGLRNTGSTFDAASMIDWPYSLNSIANIASNDAGSCSARCGGIAAEDIELVYDNNGVAIGANLVVDCEEALCEEPYWESSSCSLIGWASESVIFEDSPGMKRIEKTYYVIDVCQYDENTGEGRWSWKVNATILNSAANEVRFIISDVAAERGETVCVPVRVENFNNIESIQGSINWDASVAQFRSIGAFGLPGLNNGSFGLSSVGDGELSFLWFDNTTTNPATVNDGGTIFEICYDVIGFMGTSTIIELSGEPTLVEITSDNNLLPFSVENGSLIVGQSSCANDVNKPTPYCLNGITVLLEQGEVELFAIDFDAGSFDNCTDSDNLRFTYSSVLPSNDPEFSQRSSSRIFTSDDIPANGGNIAVDVYVWDEEDNYDFCTVSLKLKEDPNDFQTVEFILGEYYGAPSANVCVPLKVNNFTDIQTVQGTLKWDSDVISYSGMQNFNLPAFSLGANTNLNNVNGGVLSFIWFDNTGQTPVTLPNGSSLFEVCFELSGDKGDVSALDLVSSPTLIQVSSPGVGNRPYIVDKGSVAILDSDCEFLNTDIAWPTSNLEVYVDGLNASNIFDLFSPSNLLSISGVDSTDVFPTLLLEPNCQNIVGVSYQDEVFNLGNGLFKLIRTWTLLDWITLQAYSFNQNIVNILSEEYICDFLPNSAPVGDCDSGHSLEDDVEWPDDLDLSDHRISPDELSNSLGIDFNDTRPVFYNEPDKYDAIYVDFLGELSQNNLGIEREWTVTRLDVSGLEWTYVQYIDIDLTQFGQLVTVNTTSLRPVPGVVLNAQASTNEVGFAYTEENVDPRRDDITRNGVNIKDLMMLRAWLSGVVEFEDFEKFAADINGDQILTGLDIAEIEKIILSFPSTLSSAWEFIDQTEETSAGYAPKAHYIAYKPGDIDDSADLGQGMVQLSSDTLVVKDQLLNAGETYYIPMFISGNIEALATELHLVFDENMVSITDVTSDQSFEYTSFNIVNGNKISMVTKNDDLDSKIIDSENAFITLEIEALQNGTLKNVFGISDTEESYILNKDFDLIVIRDLFEDEISTSTKDIPLVNEGFTIFPNPVIDIINIASDEFSIDGDLHFQLFDLNGKLLINQVGHSTIEVTSLTSGTYIYKVWTREGVQTGRVVKIK